MFHTVLSLNLEVLTLPIHKNIFLTKWYSFKQTVVFPSYNPKMMMMMIMMVVVVIVVVVMMRMMMMMMVVVVVMMTTALLR